MKIIKIQLSIILAFIILICFISCGWYINTDKESFEIIHGFLESLKDNFVYKANTYISVSSRNSRDEKNGTVKDLMDYLGGEIKDYTLERKHTSKSMGDRSNCYVYYYLSIIANDNIYIGIAEVCLYDNIYPDNKGINNLEIYPKEYADQIYNSDWNIVASSNTSGIFIYDEQSNPFTVAVKYVPYDYIRGFLRSLMSNDIKNASSYLSVSAVNSTDTNNKSVDDMLEFIDGKITKYRLLGSKDFYNKTTKEKSEFYQTFIYEIETDKKTFKGEIKAYSYDTENHDNVGVFYVEVADKEYYDKYYFDNEKSDRTIIPGIYIYEETYHPY